MTSDINRSITVNYTLQNITPEGYIRADLSQPTNTQHYYHIKDHLGNVRVVAQLSSFNNSMHIHQVNDYYPFGMTYQDDLVTNDLSENVYLYNGKERQKEMREGWYDYGARFYDPQLGRWHVGDPLAEKYYSQSPFHFSGNNPLKFIDINGMNYDEYQFNSNGRYTGKVEKEGEHYGTIAGKDGQETTTFSFADPVNDPKSIEAGEITQVVEVGDDAIASTLGESGVNDSENQENKYEYIQKESNATSPEGSGKMDYVITGSVEVDGKDIKLANSSNTLFITSTKSGKVAHNNYNFGNFLWGAGAKSLGIPKLAAKLAAHYNSVFNDPKHKGKLDSKDDQRSISLGYEWKK